MRRKDGLLVIGFAMTGSFCNFEKCLKVLETLTGKYDVLPIMSFNAYSLDTRFGSAESFISRVEALCGKSVVHTIPDAEPLGPKIKLDCLCICPCTGNTLSKLAAGIYDTPVTLAAKAHLRSGNPLCIALATNDGLSGNFESIAKMMTRKNVYFVPLSQDDFKNKPYSLVCDFSLVPHTIEATMKGTQPQPVFF